jgi:DNA-binding response OmpR family regulator
MSEHDEPLPSSLRVLLVEDDAKLAWLVSSYLESHGVVVTVAKDGEEGVACEKKDRFDAVVLDLMLPKLDGVEVCRAIRKRSSVPILMATARGEEADRVLGLEGGADDYVTKPFSPRELLARIRAQVRRARGQSGPTNVGVIEVGRICVDAERRTVTVDGKDVALTSYEFDLLHALASHAGRVLSREVLLDLAKGATDESFDRSIDVRISRIRQKLGDDSKQPRLLKTVRGAGYVLVFEPKK